MVWGTNLSFEDLRSKKKKKKKKEYKDDDSSLVNEEGRYMFTKDNTKI